MNITTPYPMFQIFQILFDSEEELGTDLEAAQGRDEDDNSDNEMLVITIPADLSAIPWA